MSQTDLPELPSQMNGGRIVAAPRLPQAVPYAAVLKAFAALLFVDGMMRLAGYARLRESLSRCRVRRTSPSPDVVAERVLAAVERAAVYYPRRTMCLQRSAVLTWLLRKSGVPAELVIGCRHTPFYAHAWVEVAGQVVGDASRVRETYQEMERI
jgi:hypothetical protein